MKKDELKTLIRGGTRKNETLPLTDLAALKAVAKVSLEIDRDTNDYFYKIDINDLVDKEIDPKILSENGWELSLDEEYIHLFL